MPWDRSGRLVNIGAAASLETDSLPVKGDRVTLSKGGGVFWAAIKVTEIYGTELKGLVEEVSCLHGSKVRVEVGASVEFNCENIKILVRPRLKP
ncbi:hypothetical protein [Hahella chejuensis]|uniref:hypothetical protein n=1 Tax=Hahella chejuensis TaxID=158327 RepID=UPI0011D0A5EE|nr:hypothetical protein [Hahella chejuensis]